MSGHRRLPLLIAVLAAGAIIVSTQLKPGPVTGEPPAPALPVLPGELPPSDPKQRPTPEMYTGPEEPDTSRDIDFRKPVPRDVPVPIGRATVTVPKGAYWYEGTEDGADGSRTFFSVIEKGRSYVIIDPVTLTVRDRRVEPEHAGEFQRILDELEAQRK